MQGLLEAPYFESYKVGFALISTPHILFCFCFCFLYVKEERMKEGKKEEKSQCLVLIGVVF